MKKEFNLKIYAAVVFFVIAGLLATITVATYKSRYNGFSPEKTATAFVQSIVETGDGYNAYKNTPWRKFVTVCFFVLFSYICSAFPTNSSVIGLFGITILSNTYSCIFILIKFIFIR